jgi:hypothetical protein
MGNERPATAVKVATDDDTPGAVVELVLEKEEEASASERGMVVLTVCA